MQFEMDWWPKAMYLKQHGRSRFQAVKETPRAIPHCHIIPIESCSVVWDWEGDHLRCTVRVSAHWKTGVEMGSLRGLDWFTVCLGHDQIVGKG